MSQQLEDYDHVAKRMFTTSVRIMRVLCATGIFQESGIERYKAGRLAWAFRAEPALKDNLSTQFASPTREVHVKDNLP